MRFKALFIMTLMLPLAACSTLPESVGELEDARQLVSAVDRDPVAAEVAGQNLTRAKQALQRAEEAYDEGEDLEDIRHHAYVAARYAEIAQERAAESRARTAIEQSEATRTRVLLQARERQAAEARMLAEARGEEAERSMAEAERQRERAEMAVAEASRLADELANIETELENVKAEQTERGLVLTLSDVLFDTAEATLKPGADQAIDRLAAFLQESPDRALLIEGHTDARGTEAFNEDLSERRANAVRDALVAQGIDPQRLRTVGLGEGYPVATNDTVAGQQENRRVEIIVSDAEGEFPDSIRRAAN